MKGFFIKKAFFDGWDNLIGMVVMNIIYLALFFLGVSATYLTQAGPLWFFLAVIAILFVRYFRHSLVLFGLYVFIIALVLFIIPFYMINLGIAGKIISCILIWLVIFCIICLPYYFALSSYLPGDRPLKTLRKCFIVAGDNMGFTLFFFLYNIVCIALTLFTVGLVPGVAGMNLASHDAVRLLMLKYDYLEDNPEADRKHIPWTELLYDEEDKIGPRSFKSMIFPWK